MFSLNRLESYEPFISVDGVFTKDEIASIRSLIEGKDSVRAKIGGEVSVEDETVRSSRIVRLEPTQENLWIFQKLATGIFEANSRMFGLDLDFIESLQLTEYDASYSGHYGQHMDAAYGKESIAHRKLSISVQLSDPSEYEGGELILYPNSFGAKEFAPKDFGTVIMFRSHIIHEVTPVTSGKRYSLVAWVHGPLPRGS